MPAIVGTLFYVVLYRTAGTPDELHYESIVAVLLSLFNVIWSTVFLEMWKRHSSEIAFEWGVLDDIGEQSAVSPLFKVSPITRIHYSLESKRGQKEAYRYARLHLE